MADILSSINTRKTAQSAKARPDQVKNRAGGYVFQIGDEERLHRFLTLGTDGPSYYASDRELTRENADVVFRMAANKPVELIQAIVDVSVAGRAPKNKQAIFALAIAASAEDVTTRQKAMAVMHKVCRTGTHVFEFNKYVEQFRGRGRVLNRGVANWYLKEDVNKLAYQAVKYRQRENWTHRDLLRLSKPGQYGPKTPERNALFDFIIKGELKAWDLEHDVLAFQGDLAIIYDYQDAKHATKASEWVEIVGRGNGMSWEMLPDAALKSPHVWEALLEVGIPATALMRQLPRLTNVGLSGKAKRLVADLLADPERLKKGRVHPVNVLVAQKTYAQGRSDRSKLVWTPERAWTDALDAAFYNAFDAVEPTGKRRLIALDVSGSMGHQISGYPLSCREAAAAMALVTLATEKDVEVIGFTSGRRGAPSRRFIGYQQRGRIAVPVYQQGSGFAALEHRNSVSKLDLTSRRRLDDNIQAISGLPFGGTDCALPFLWANSEGLDFDSVEIFTDNESWAGDVHVHQAATDYRNKVGHDVKLVAAAFTATNYSVVDPKDPSGMNVSGFDSAVPQLVNDFIGDRL